MVIICIVIVFDLQRAIRLHFFELPVHMGLDHSEGGDDINRLEHFVVGLVVEKSDQVNLRIVPQVGLASPVGLVDV